MTTYIANLIATFYGKRDNLKGLYRQLSLAFIPSDIRENFTEADEPDDWVEAGSTQLLYRFKPANYHDTQFIQLVLAQEGETLPELWTAMRQQLESALPTKAARDNLWGYSLIYAAPLTPIGLAKNILRNLIQSTAPLWSPEIKSTELAKVDRPLGTLWLTHVPLLEQESATTYLALSSPEKEEEFFYHDLYGPAAYLLEPDLIAHKVYYHLRQAPADWKPKFEAKIDVICQKTNLLFDNLTDTRQVSNLMNQLGQQYGGELTLIMRDLGRLQISLDEQHHNYLRLLPSNSPLPLGEGQGGGILAFHLAHLETGRRQFALMLTEARTTQESTHTAMTMAQTHLSQVQNQLAEKAAQNQDRIQDLVAVLSMALAIPQLVSPEAAVALLNLFGLAIDLDTHRLVAMVAQFFITALFAGLALLLVRYFKKRN